jgi:hypothetical protein
LFGLGKQWAVISGEWTVGSGEWAEKREPHSTLSFEP